MKLRLNLPDYLYFWFIESKASVSPNPFANVHTKEEKENVWNLLKSKAVRLSREEAEKLLKEAIRLQKAEK